MPALESTTLRLLKQRPHQAMLESDWYVATLQRVLRFARKGDGLKLFRWSEEASSISATFLDHVFDLRSRLCYVPCAFCTDAGGWRGARPRRNGQKVLIDVFV
jgi:hypothetical protein